MLEPARSTTLPGLHSLKVPAGDLKIFDQSFKTEVEMLKPDIDMGAYLPKPARRGKGAGAGLFPDLGNQLYI